MDRVPSILIVSWNRREYFERTIAHLLADTADYRLYFWDNGSTDGVADIITGLRDDRIAERRLNAENVGQAMPWHWLLDQAAGDIMGKLDDDILGPPGWMTRFSEMLATEQRFGTLGGWVYLESDWDEALASHKIAEIGPYRIFQNAWVAGCIFLGRKSVLKRYSSTDPKLLGTPIQQPRMMRDGYINGYPLPMPFAENLDDPRSPFCRMNRPGGWDQFAAYTARMRNFSGPQEYGEWIARDAHAVLTTPIATQLRDYAPGAVDRIRSKVLNKARKILAR